MIHINVYQCVLTASAISLIFKEKIKSEIKYFLYNGDMKQNRF